MGRSARTEQAAWPLAHPPAVLWFPDSASAARLPCYWLDFSARKVATAAEAARRHAIDQQPEVRGWREQRRCNTSPVRGRVFGSSALIGFVDAESRG